MDSLLTLPPQFKKRFKAISLHILNKTIYQQPRGTFRSEPQADPKSTAGNSGTLTGILKRHVTHWDCNKPTIVPTDLNYGFELMAQSFGVIRIVSGHGRNLAHTSM
jgi:hypothetical protein